MRLAVLSLVDDHSHPLHATLPPPTHPFHSESGEPKDATAHRRDGGRRENDFIRAWAALLPRADVCGEGPAINHPPPDGSLPEEAGKGVSIEARGSLPETGRKVE
jgi:hypothetical protein